MYRAGETINIRVEDGPVREYRITGVHEESWTDGERTVTIDVRPTEAEPQSRPAVYQCRFCGNPVGAAISWGNPNVLAPHPFNPASPRVECGGSWTGVPE